MNTTRRALLAIAAAVVIAAGLLVLANVGKVNERFHCHGDALCQSIRGADNGLTSDAHEARSQVLRTVAVAGGALLLVCVCAMLASQSTDPAPPV